MRLTNHPFLASQVRDTPGVGDDFSHAAEGSHTSQVDVVKIR
jgi:hypothetical protein